MGKEPYLSFLIVYGTDAGVIEGGDGACVRIHACYSSKEGATAAFCAEFGCTWGEDAILVDYEPVTGQLPDMDHWVKFPDRFMGRKVYYRSMPRMVAQ